MAGLHWVLQRRRSHVEFDQREFILRISNKNAANSRTPEFRSIVADVERHLSSDPRFASNGHDYFELFRWTLRVNGIYSTANVDLFEHIIVACIELAELREYQFWQCLELAFRTSAASAADSRNPGS